MAALSSFYSSVRLYAQQCPDTTIDKFLIEAAREFCRVSWFYQEVYTANIVSTQADYTITPSASQDLIAIDSVKVNTSPVPAIRAQDVDAVSDTFTTTAWKFEPNSTLTLYPTPTANYTNGLVARIIIMPQEGTTTIPDQIYRRYKETIVCGALAYILSLQNEAWSNPQLASQMMQRFYNGCYLAKNERERGFVSRPLSVKPRTFALRRWW